MASVQLVPPSSYSCVLLLFHQPMQINGNFCGLVLNQPLGGLHVIEGLPLLADSTDGMASVAAYPYQQHSVVFIGTRSGSLKKVSPGTLGMWASGRTEMQTRAGVKNVRLSPAAPWMGPGPWGKGDFPGWDPGAQLCSAGGLSATHACSATARRGLNRWLPVALGADRAHLRSSLLGEQEPPLLGPQSNERGDRCGPNPPCPLVPSWARGLQCRQGRSCSCSRVF